MAAQHPHLRFQYEAIQAFKDAVVEQMEREVKERTRAGMVMLRWQQSPQVRQRFVDVAVEKFFTGDRYTATKEFQERAGGSYGLVVRTSLDDNGVSVYSRAQGMALGYSLQKSFFAFASDPLVLQGNSVIRANWINY